ncbi:MAG TPA: FtsX-like permease family protein, partial [Bryobacteraceae bacterium]|nr:FtsX-like permease family protein [Bryobacteraceae bacterium]
VRADSISPPRALTRVFGFFAVLALVIAIGGLASMLALSIQQRQREIGIRIAVGATPGAVTAGFVRQGLLLTGVGLGVGFACAFGMSRLLGSLLFEVTPTDPLTFAAVAALLLAAAFAACVLPARQAARVDPQIALRSE